MRFVYAGPPYMGQAKRHYGDHPDYAEEVEHAELITRMVADYDGWALSLSVKSLPAIMRLCPVDVLTLAWETVAIFTVVAWAGTQDRVVW